MAGCPPPGDSISNCTLAAMQEQVAMSLIALPRPLISQRGAPSPYLPYIYSLSSPKTFPTFPSIQFYITLPPCFTLYLFASVLSLCRRDTRKRRPPTYRVLLHNDNVNKREYVVSVLLKVVEGYTVEDALNVMQEAHHNGLALVTVCSQEQAENICEGMRNGGLISTMEPAGPNGT